MTTPPRLDAVWNRFIKNANQTIINLDVYPPLNLAETRKELLRALEADTLTKDILESALASLPEEGVPTKIVLETLRSKVSNDSLEALRESLNQQAVTRGYLEEIIARHLSLNAQEKLAKLLA